MGTVSRYVAAIDQGTTSTRCAIVDRGGTLVAINQQEHRQILPKAGWVAHDGAEIWERTQAVAAAAMTAAGVGPSDLAAVGITNQRETTLAWDRESGAPLADAIVWQDTRTDSLCRRLAGDAGADRFRLQTGLPLATYFSGPKMRWLLDNDSAVAAAAEAGSLAFGTIDSWLLWQLTGNHLTDVTNASRTMLMDLRTLQWDPGLGDAIGVPVETLPRIRPSVGVFGEAGGVLAGVPVAGVLGDQQAAMFGQACFAPGTAKNTYGTGCFLLLHTGGTPVHSEHGMLTTVAYQLTGEPAQYALEGSVAIAGAAVQWLRDNLGLIDSASEVESLAAAVPDNGGVYFVPAFSGLFAPYWRDDARGVIAGLTRFATAAHLARATLEAAALQTFDVVEAMQADAGVALQTLKVDGGMVGNELLMQFQADVLGADVVLPRIVETTVLGAAFAAGIAVGFWSGTDEVADMWQEGRRYRPSMGAGRRETAITQWRKAVERTYAWV